MANPGGNLRFPDKPAGDIRRVAGNGWRQNLERHIDIEREVPGQINRSHPAGADFFDDAAFSNDIIRFEARGGWRSDPGPLGIP
jgi:hypothetical protein